MTAFAQQTSGPATSTGKNTNIGDLIQDSKNNVVEIVGKAGLAQALRSALLVANYTTLPARTSVTTAQTLFSYPVNGGLLAKLNRTLKVTGFYTYNGVADQTFVLKYGATALCTVVIPGAGAQGDPDVPAKIEFLINVAQVVSPTSITVQAQGKLDIVMDTTSINEPAAVFMTVNTAFGVAINPNGASTLSLTVAGSTGTIQAIQLQILTIEVLN